MNKITINKNNEEDCPYRGYQDNIRNKYYSDRCCINGHYCLNNKNFKNCLVYKDEGEYYNDKQYG